MSLDFPFYGFINLTKINCALQFHSFFIVFLLCTFLSSERDFPLIVLLHISPATWSSHRDGFIQETSSCSLKNAKLDKNGTSQVESIFGKTWWHINSPANLKVLALFPTLYAVNDFQLIFEAASSADSTVPINVMKMFVTRSSSLTSSFQICFSRGLQEFREFQLNFHLTGEICKLRIAIQTIVRLWFWIQFELF